MTILAWLRYRLNLRPPDGTICAKLRFVRCEDHLRLGFSCRCLKPADHRGGHECGQGECWPGDNERTRAWADTS